MDYVLVNQLKLGKGQPPSDVEASVAALVNEALDGLEGTPAAAADPPPGKASGRQRYDPAFEKAVASGLLSPWQAYSRGKREAYALGLVARFDLAEATAYAVADNAMTLADARKNGPPKADSTSPVNGLRWMVWALVIVLAVIAAGAYWMRPDPRSESTAATTQARDAGVHTDESGRVLRIIGDSPQQVLEMFCGAQPEFDPYGVMASTSAAVPIRIGILRDSAAPEQLMAIAIREERQTGRWFAGDGKQPLIPGSAPPGAPEASWGSAR